MNVYVYKRPKNPIEKNANDESKRVAETIRAKRELELGAADYDIHVSSRKKSDFFVYASDFISSYTKKDIRMIEASIRYLKEYNEPPNLPAKQMTESYCEKFKNWLDIHPNLNGDTPHDYFSKFKKIVKSATRDKLFSFNPAADVVNKIDKKRIGKDILTISELQSLAKTERRNSTVKRAFLFACNTRLRFCDIVDLRYNNIRNDSISIKQQKTDRKVTINLNTTAHNLIGPVSDPNDLIFPLPSHNAVLKNLKNWAAKAEVVKHVTFHVARHSFATNLLIFDTDVKSVASLLGHAGLNHVDKYVRVVDELKQRGVDRLPELNLSTSNE